MRGKGGNLISFERVTGPSGDPQRIVLGEDWGKKEQKGAFNGEQRFAEEGDRIEFGLS